VVELTVENNWWWWCYSSPSEGWSQGFLDNPGSVELRPNMELRPNRDVENNIDPVYRYDIRIKLIFTNFLLTFSIKEIGWRSSKHFRLLCSWVLS